MKHHRNCNHYKVWWNCPSEKISEVESRSVFYVGDFCTNYEPDIPELVQHNHDVHITGGEKK